MPYQKRHKAGEAAPAVAEPAVSPLAGEAKLNLVPPEPKKKVVGLHLAGFKVKALNWFKDGGIHLAGSGRFEWAALDEDVVTVQELEQLEAVKPGNWEKVERVHERVEQSPAG